MFKMNFPVAQALTGDHALDLRAIGDHFMETCVGETDERLVAGLREARDALYLIAAGAHGHFIAPPQRWMSSPEDLRMAGWAVAVHNDYRLNGEPYTFWLFTKGGRAIKGEGRNDLEALNACRIEAARVDEIVARERCA